MDTASGTEGVVFEAVTSLEGKVLGEILGGIKPRIKEKHNSPDIISEAVKPEVAFEVFAGKRYWGRKSDDCSDNIASLQQQISERVLSQQRTAASGFSRVETPMEKYQRLRAELTEFGNHIRALDAVRENGNGSEVGKPLIDPVLPKVREGVTELLKQLAVLEGNPSLGPLLLSNSDLAILSIKAQEDLSAKVADTIKSIGIKGKPESKETPQDNSSAEIKATVHNMTLESRIARLEAVLGQAASASSTLQNPLQKSGNGNTNLFAAVDALEEKLRMLEPGRLDAIHRRAKILSSELDAIGKKMKRYGSGMKTGGTDQEKGKILSMYDKMMKWDDVCEELPLVIDRLRSVSAIHKQAVEFDERISRMESIQETLSNDLKVDEQVVKNLEASLVENAELMGKNMALLDGRFQELAKQF